MCGTRTLLNPQLLQILDWSGKHGLIIAGDDWPLQKLRVRGHDLEKFVVTQIPSNNMFTIGWLFRAEYVVRCQPRAT